MAEDAKQADTGTDQVKTEDQQKEQTSDKTQEFDPKNLSDEQFDKVFSDERVFRHNRFKELAAKAKRADELEKAQSEAENKSLEDQKKFEELAGKYKSENEGLTKRLEDMQVTQAISAKASALGIVDLEAAALLINRSSISIKDGTVDGVDEALKQLVENKPYLVSKSGSKQVGSPSNPSSDTTEQGTKKYKLSQIQDAKFYQANEKDIMEALRLGLIEDDVNK